MIEKVHIRLSAPLDATGHPAMSIPGAMSDGLPDRVMLIGKHYDESAIYGVAHAFEQGSNWRQR